MTTMFDNEDLIRSDGNFVKRVYKIDTIREMDVIPEGYGVAWWRWDRMEAVIAPLPWNVILRWAREAYFWLRRGGYGNRCEKAAYDRGLHEGRSRVNRQRFFEYEQLEQKVKQEYAKGWSAGRLALYDELMADLNKGGPRGETQH